MKNFGRLKNCDEFTSLADLVYASSMKLIPKAEKSLLPTFSPQFQRLNVRAAVRTATRSGDLR